MMEIKNHLKAAAHHEKHLGLHKDKVKYFLVHNFIEAFL